jgi:ubiquinone/menaquinone biosynthesis C-methylase UbiE
MIKERCNYTVQAKKWQRESPINLSDFVARPILFSQIKNVIKNKVVLDAGCGEGYFSRKMADFAKLVVGVDLSKGMIDCAKELEKESPKNIKYFVGDVKNLKNIKDNSVDIYISSMVVHYLTPKELFKFYSEVNRVLKKDGLFYILTSHPKILDVFKNGPKKGICLKKKEMIDDFEFYNLFLKTLTNKTIEVGFFKLKEEDHKKSIKLNKLTLIKIKNIKVKKKDVVNASLYNDLIGNTIYVLYCGQK